MVWFVLSVVVSFAPPHVQGALRLRMLPLRRRIGLTDLYTL